MAMQVLSYRIFHCSSQDPSFPVTELTNQGMPPRSDT